jgi:hypothetical protein
MTDLERARAHLLACQSQYAFFRKSQISYRDRAIEVTENNFLAALSWVWEEQEKRRISDYREALAHIRRQMRRAA